MHPDLSTIQFNKNQKNDSAALEAISGVRFIIVSFTISFLVAVIAISGSLGADFFSHLAAQIPGLVLFAIWVVAFGCGAYGSYSVASAVGWSGFISFFLIASMLIPYVKLVALIALAVKAFSLIGSSAYKFSLLGAAKKRA
jgi:hypothetical protein